MDRLHLFGRQVRWIKVENSSLLTVRLHRTKIERFAKICYHSKVDTIWWRVLSSKGHSVLKEEEVVRTRQISIGTSSHYPISIL